MKFASRTAFIFLLAMLCLPALPALAASSSQGDTAAIDGVQIDRAKVYFGDVARFDPDQGLLVGLVNSKEVYEATEPVKTLRQEDPPSGSARYKQLMREATSIFKRTLEKVAGQHSLILIVENGGITGYKQTVDVTKVMIANL